MQAARNENGSRRGFISRKPALSAEEKAVHAEIRVYSDLWLGGERDPAQDDYLKIVAAYSKRWNQRISLPRHPNWSFQDVNRKLKEQGVDSYASAPVLADNEIWYFFNEVAHVRALLMTLPQDLHAERASPHRWRQRLCIPFTQEHRRAHLGAYLAEREIPTARMVLERSNQVWYFLETIKDVQAFLHGMDSYHPELRPDTGPPFER